MSTRMVGLLVVGVALSGCAFTPQKAQIAPHVEYGKSDVGQGKVVSVAVTDERDSTDLGHRGAANIGSGAKISTDQDMPAVFKQAIFEGLKAQGFVPVDFDKLKARQLAVQIRSINYSTSTGFWTGGVDTKASIKAQAAVDGNTYEKLYRYDGEERVVFVPTADHNTQLINKAVDDVLSQMFADPSLLSTLAR